MIEQIFIWMGYLVTLFIVLFWLFYYLENKPTFDKENKQKVKIKNYPMVTVVIPAYNKEETVGDTITSAVNLDYPESRLKIIIVNDGSTDKTKEQILSIISRYKSKNISLINKKNEGKGKALNVALKQVEGEYFACLDADSFVKKDALKKMVSLYQESGNDLVIVTPVLKIDKPFNMLQYLQKLEYILSMFIVRLMGYMDANYIAPGPFTLYKKDIIIKKGGFDEKNLVEDQEIAYRMQESHYKIKQCPGAIVKTVAPKSFREFYKQRNRWMKGSFLNIFKFKKMMLNKNYGDFGIFQMPFNIFQYALSLVTLFFFYHFVIWPFIKWIIDLSKVGFDIFPYIRNFKLSFNFLDINIGPTFLLYVVLFLSIITLIVAFVTYKETFSRVTLIYIFPFLFIYYIVLSFISLVVIIESIIGRNQKW